MRFAAPLWLYGSLFALVVGALLIGGALRRRQATRRFGDDALVTALKTARTGRRRALSGVLLVCAVALAFAAAAQPQYGRGTKLIPATNLDVVLALDFSKSMYARDVSPSRIDRAKVEISSLIQQLPGARFAAVAFAGTAMSFPMTSDGAAVAQFFRGLEPNDMPVGGTAIGRSLEAARQLLERDPRSKNHARVIVLVTDGEDLEGDPVSVAKQAGADGITIHVVHIGGRSPEPIPDIGPDGTSSGMRTDDQGQLLTTQLDADAEAQMAQVASETGGMVVRPQKGATGIEEITERLRRLVSEELSERVETVYADVFQYPLGLAVLLLLIETMIGSSERRVRREVPPLAPRRRPRIKRRALPSATGASIVLLGLLSVSCKPIDDLFTRYSPRVDEAIEALEHDDPSTAVEILVEYLGTGECDAGVLTLSDRARELGDASYDLGLSYATEAGAEHPTGDPTTNPGAPPSLVPGTPNTTPPGAVPGTPGAASPGAAPGQAPANDAIECALRALGPIAGDEAHPLALRARAHYVAGNLEMLRKDYRAAVASFDGGLRLLPAMKDGDELGRDLAFNRAIALELAQQQEEQQQKNDQQSNQDQQDGDEEEQSKDSQDQSEQDQDQDQDQDQNGQQDEQEQQDQEQESSDQKQDEQSQGEEEKPEDQGAENPSDGDQDPPRDEQPEQPQDAPQQASAAQNREEANQQDRILDELERAPTWQQHNAQQRAGRIRRIGGMEDK